MPLGDILEEVGGGLDPSFATNPHIPGPAAAIAGALTGFASGRAARRRLAASSRARQFEERLGIPLDFALRLSPQALSQYMKNKGLLGDDELSKPLGSLGGLSIDQIMNEGAPASTVTAHEPMVGPMLPGQERPQIPVQKPRAAIPPLSTVREQDRPYYYNQLNPSIGVPESPGDVALRKQREAQTGAYEAALPYAGPRAAAELEQTEASTEHMRALTASSKQARELAKTSSKSAAAPAELVASLRRNGVQIPEGVMPTYMDLDYYMKGSYAWGELQGLVDQYAEGFADQADQGKKITKKDIEQFADKNLGGQLELISNRMTRDDPKMARTLFVNQILNRLSRYDTAIRNRPGEGLIPEESYTLPGEDREQ